MSCFHGTRKSMNILIRPLRNSIYIARLLDYISVASVFFISEGR